MSLFTNVTVNEACKIAERKLRAESKLRERTDLDANEIIKLLELCLNTTYFQWRDELFELPCWQVFLWRILKETL